MVELEIKSQIYLTLKLILLMTYHILPHTIVTYTACTDIEKPSVFLGARKTLGKCDERVIIIFTIKIRRSYFEIHSKKIKMNNKRHITSMMNSTHFTSGPKEEFIYAHCTLEAE